MAHVLIAGLGDLGSSLATQLIQRGHEVTGIRRGDTAPAGVTLMSRDLRGQVHLSGSPVDLLYIIMTPSRRDPAGYAGAFLDIPQRLLDALQARQPLPPTVFVSSTAVFGDQQDWANEHTPARPDNFRGEILLQAEAALSARTISTTVRFSGIYGPGRERLLRQLAGIVRGEAAPPPAAYTNRIHRDDCVSMLRYVGELWLDKSFPPPVIIGTDHLPAVNLEIFKWLAEQQGQRLDLPAPAQIAGKRVKSLFLEDASLKLRYPDFRAGYAALLRKP